MLAHMEGKSAFYSNTNDYQIIINKLNEMTLSSMTKKISSSLIQVSVDNLSIIISSQGNEFVEKMMNDLVLQVKKKLKENDLVVRTEKDKFHVIIENYNDSEIKSKSEEIYRAIQSYGCVISLEPIQLKASMGSVKIPDYHHENIAIETINQAYIALNDAKDLFLNYVAFEDNKKRHEESKNQMLLAHFIQNAYLKNQMCLAFQPIVNAETKEIEYYECLLRVVNNDGSASSAGPFIPIAEKMGFIEVMDGLALKMAVHELEIYRDLVLSVNVSSFSIHNSSWLAVAVSLLTDSQVASRLIVEITETNIQYDFDKISYFVSAVKALGCKVAIDDFGSGYTSFKQIKNLPVDILKIDGSYVRGIAENNDDLFFVQTLISFAKNFGIKSVAEFVENKEISDIVTDIGAEYLQGHYYFVASTQKPWAN